MGQGIGVIGAGGWGTALAKLLCEKGEKVTLWSHGERSFREIRDHSENASYLPGVILPGTLQVTRSLEETVCGQELLFCVVPSHGVREVMGGAANLISREATLVCGTKGIEEETLMTMGEVLVDILGPERRDRMAFLSGPSFALEAAQGLPTAVTLAAYREAVCSKIQETLNTSSFRVYTSGDVVGVQVGGVVKNIIAIAAGICDGLQLGYNARAGLITRGLAEMTRLATQMGANALTLAGLPGLGDLILTCTGDLSRNRRVGLEIARGRKIKEILAGTSMIAEGVRNARSVYQLSRRLGVEVPIVEQVFLVLYEGKKPTDAVCDLLQRSPKPELP